MRETVLATIAMLAISVLLTAVFSSPDEPTVTLARWATADRYDFLATAASELDGSSETARSGPPYVAGNGESLPGGLSPQRLAGIRIPIDAERDLVLTPLAGAGRDDARLRAALLRYTRAQPASRAAWVKEYKAALDYARGELIGNTQLPPGRYGPVATLMAHLLALARSGALDGMLTSGSGLYGSDYTKPLLFLADGEYLERLAKAQRLLAAQWGMTNETGDFPGQPWLWLATYWYQVSPFADSHNVDVQVWTVMALLSLALVLVPWIPGVRSIPRWIPVHRLIWRDYYRAARNE
jgi:hypothetical protein